MSNNSTPVFANGSSESVFNESNTADQKVNSGRLRIGLLVWALILFSMSILPILAGFGVEIDLWLCILIVLTLSGLALLGLSITSYLSSRKN